MYAIGPPEKKKTPEAAAGDQTEHVHPPKPHFVIKSDENKCYWELAPNQIILDNKNGFGWSQWIDTIIGIILPRVKNEICGFCVKTRTVDGVRHPWQGLFFVKTTRPLSEKHVYCCFVLLIF